MVEENSGRNIAYKDMHAILSAYDLNMDDHISFMFVWPQHGKLAIGKVHNHQPNMSDEVLLSLKHHPER